MSAEGWKVLHTDEEAQTCVAVVDAETHTKLGQLLLTDPLTAMMGYEDLGVDESWSVQVHVVNAHIPSGPLPHPDDDLDWILWVIRKILGHFHLFRELKLAIVILYRFDPRAPLTRQNVLEKLADARRSAPRS